MGNPGHSLPAELSSIDFTDEYGMLEGHIAAKGGEVLYEMAATQLVRDSEGTVTGVAAHDDANDADVLFNAARGVILACGGYSGNADYIRTYIPWLDPDALEQYAPNAALGGEDGDAIAMCLAAGIPIGPAPHMPEVHFVHGAVATEGVLFVDGLGQRIPDSEKCLAHEIRTQIVMRRAGHRTWRLTDGKDGYPEYIPDGLPESMWPDYSEPLDDYETLDELAEAFGFDPEVLAATVEAWNAAVEAGEDDAYGCDLSTAMKLDTPPYHAKECKGANLAMVGGPLVNARMQALGDDYRPVGGLYAVGSSCCGFFGTNYPMDLKFGVHRAFAAVSGYLAAEDIVAGA